MAEAQKKILCIEDDRETAALIAEELVDRGYAVSLAHDGREGLAAILKTMPDLVLSDISMPLMSGFELLERLIALAPRFAKMPFVFLTALTDRDNELKGRQLGADDYVTKPFLVRELIARLQAVLRRIRVESAEGEPVLRAGNLELDVPHRRLRRSGEEVRLSPTEFELLRYLMQHQDVAIEHARLLQAVWGPEYGQELEYLRAYVRLLRKKIEEDPTQPQYLLTEPWLGYRFRSPSDS